MEANEEECSRMERVVNSIRRFKVSNSEKYPQGLAMGILQAALLRINWNGWGRSQLVVT